ncbi:unnamed protein product [Rotaria sp. Silwood2]|nr:unnamed protein product [Rotaria sp. Silwood2]
MYLTELYLQPEFHLFWRNFSKPPVSFGKNSILRVAFVAYRDYTNAERFDVIDFHQAPNLDLVQNKIESQKPIANNDVCDDVQGGLEKALGLSWTRTAENHSSIRNKDKSSCAAQMIIWVGDCPRHTAFCHDKGTTWDKHLTGLPDVRPMKEIIMEIKDRGIFLLLSKFTKHVDFMFKNIEKIFKDDNKNNQVKRISLNPEDTTSFLNQISQHVNTIIATEFM